MDNIYYTKKSIPAEKIFTKQKKVDTNTWSGKGIRVKSIDTSHIKKHQFNPDICPKCGGTGFYAEKLKHAKRYHQCDCQKEKKDEK